MESGETKVQDVLNATKGSINCRIPQRLPSARQKFTNKSKVAVNSKSAVVSAPQPRFVSRTSTRPLSGEPVRLKTTSRTKDDVTLSKHEAYVTRSSMGKTDKERFLLPKVQKPSVIPKRINNDTTMSNKMFQPIITVPVTQKQPAKTLYTNRTITRFPDQDTINRHEKLELQQGDLEGIPSPSTDLNEGESITSQSEKVTDLKLTWQEKTKQFERIKNELNSKQRAIMEIYATLGVTHQKLSVLGQHVSLPPADELHLMNVANFTPDQLLRLCANDLHADEIHKNTATLLTLDMNKLYNMPSKLVGTCEKTIVKRKEIIDTLEVMTTKKDISLHQLLKKIKEFKAENEMLSCSLEKVKNEFFEDLNEIVAYMNKSINDVMAAQLQNEQLTYQILDLNAEKDDLRKQIHNTDHFKSNVHKNKLEELEKQLKEEKCKRTIMRDRLTRAEGQAKTSSEHASQLGSTLEQSRSKCWNLERTVQQLRDQNQKLQDDFDKELNKFTEAIRENTSHLEEIADAREKLQAEKEELEKRLTELSTNYTESLEHVKQEMSSNVVKLIELEKRYEDERDDKNKLANKVESLCSQLLESELRHKDILKQLQEKESQLSKTVECYRELEIAKQNLAIANKEMDVYRNRLDEEIESVRNIERNFEEALDMEKKLRHDLKNKDNYILELQNKFVLLEKQLQESEDIRSSRDEELAVLTAQLQEDFGDFKNLNELKEIINQQRTNLLEATRQNDELTEELRKKDIELDQQTEKEEEHANIIKILQNNLEMRTQADMDLNQQILDKNTEIESLIINLDTRKEQINQLEKIILTLEDQTRKFYVQRRKDKDKIVYLENKIAEHETLNLDRKKSLEPPGENLDSIIKILEDELGTAFETESNQNNNSTHTKKTYVVDRITNKKQEKYESHDSHSPKKINACSDAYDECKRTYLDRKNANTSIDTQNYHSNPRPGCYLYNTQKATKAYEIKESKENAPSHKDIRNLNVLPSVQIREDKKFKMFKFAGHRL